MLSNGSDFFDVTLVWSGYKDGGAIKPKPAGREWEKKAILSDFIFGSEILTITIKACFSPVTPQSFIDYS